MLPNNSKWSENQKMRLLSVVDCRHTVLFRSQGRCGWGHASGFGLGPGHEDLVVTKSFYIYWFEIDPTVHRLRSLLAVSPLLQRCFGVAEMYDVRPHLRAGKRLSLSYLPRHYCCEEVDNGVYKHVRPCAVRKDGWQGGPRSGIQVLTPLV